MLEKDVTGEHVIWPKDSEPRNLDSGVVFVFVLRIGSPRKDPRIKPAGAWVGSPHYPIQVEPGYLTYYPYYLGTYLQS